MKRGAKGTKAAKKSGAGVRGAGKPRKRVVSGGRDLAKELARAQEQQAATSEILRVISRSRTDAQPVFDAIAQSAAQLCGAEFCHVFRFDGASLHFAAHHGLSAKAFAAGRRLYPMPPGRGTAAARAILSGAIEQIPDVQADPDYAHGRFAKTVNYRSIVAVPMLRDGVPIGAIAVARARKGRFPERQLELLRTFADQAVIAIENVRLFRELDARNRDLTEALEQQTATGEVLKVISRSAFELQPVLETVIENAVRLCGAEHGHVHRFDGELLRLAAGYSANAQMLDYLREHPNPLGPGTISGMAGLERRPIHCHDILTVKGYLRGEAQRLAGFRTILAVPMLSADALLGVLMIWKTRVEPFTEKQIELVTTFADQAAIAIENVRLFKELEARNRDLTESLEQQTATSEILRVISRSPTDVQPVFDTIAAAALKLCRASAANVYTFDGHLIRIAALRNADPQGDDAIRRVFPRPPSRDTAITRAILTCKVVAIPDVLKDPEYVIQSAAIAGGFRSSLAIPLLREGKPIGAIALGREEPGPFSDTQVALLQIFADQAVIAIENVRLFNETKEALARQTASADILRVISQSPTDAQPVFEAIVIAGQRLLQCARTAVLRCDGATYSVVAVANDERMVPAAGPPVAQVDPAANFPSRVIVGKALLHIPDWSAIELPPQEQRILQATGCQASLMLPLLRDEECIGVLVFQRTVAGAFSEQDIALGQTFADQAVIAIENVRLFKELEARNHDLTEALEQQTATSEILRVISQSPRDVQPVFDTIAAAALKLCRATSALVLRFDGEMLRLAGLANMSEQGAEAVRHRYPRPPGRANAASRAVLTRKVVVIPDVLEDPEYEVRIPLLDAGFRSIVSVPLMREESPIGAITVVRPQPGTFPEKQIALLRTFAAQAVIAIENVRLFTELEKRNSDLTEALEQQTATSEILRVISRSQTDVQPVFDTIAKAALELCGASSANVFTYDGELVHLAAFVNVDPTYIEALRKVYPRPLGRETAAVRAIETRSVVVIPNVLEDSDYHSVLGTLATAGGFRSILAVPLLREGKAIGGIAVGRTEPGPFPDAQIALLNTFADQAVIAIENVRLFNETKEALEHQKASTEVLGVISGSVADTKPVFNKILESCERLFEGHHVGMTLLGEDDLVHLGGYRGPGGEAFAKTFPYRLGLDSATGTSILERRLIHFANVQTDDGVPERMRTTGWLTNTKSQILAPMISKDRAIGAIFVGRPVVRRFTEKEIALLRTFADQAVIAIENVRLFTELEARNRDLTEALEHQTATSEILRVISSSPTDVQPVFDIIGERAEKLCEAEISVVTRVEGEKIHLAAVHGVNVEGTEAIKRYFPADASAGSTSARAVRSRSLVHIADVLADPEYDAKDAAKAGKWRGALAVPMLREGQVIGTIFVGRTSPGHFPDSKIDLLKTFADQAVIAIENVRLFNELQARTTELTRSVGELKALGEVGQAVSSTLDLEAVLSTIASRATQLAGMDGGVIHEYDEARGEFHLLTTHNLPDELADALRAAPIPKGEGAVGRMAATREPVQIGDIADGSYRSRIRAILIRHGYRSVLAVPLLREDHLLGGLVVIRKRPGDFAPGVIELMQTFATQSALAIQNARLFREIEVKGRQLEVASQHKSEFLANMSHELRTPLNAILGFSEVLAERMFGEINEKQAEYLADILESGRHLLSLINDILDLSKIEAGRMELEPSEFDLPGAIENTLILVRERAQRRGITLGRAVDERLGTIRADERKVKQVLLNLLSNALKFTPEGGRIDVRAGVQDGHAQISVTDTGVGIAPEDQATVFEEFRQVGSSAKKVEGTGLGLAISRKFVELHGGTIGVESKVGTGSTFTFTLPLQ
jgi:GAF domain-containing protein